MASEPTQITVPRETVNDESVKLLRWHVNDGDKVTSGQALADVETSKAVLELEATTDGFVKFLAKMGSEVGIGVAICLIVDSLSDLDQTPVANTPSVPEPVLQRATTPVATSASNGSHPLSAKVLAGASLDLSIKAVRFTPLAAKLAAEHGLSLESFSGSRVVRSSDVRAFMDGPTVIPDSAPVESKAVRPVQSDKPPVSTGVEVRWEELPRRKLVEIKQISAGMSNALLSSVTLAVPTAGLKAAVAASGIEDLSTSAIILYETARLLRKHPMFNAVYWNSQAGLYERVNIGWALDDGSGLVVPVLEDVDKLSLSEISDLTRDIIDRFVDGKLTVKDFVGATFTLSDLSSEGVFSFAPLVSQGQAAILGVGAEFFVGRSPIGFQNYTLAFDHQLGDGRMAAKFLQDLAERLAGYESTFSPPPAPLQELPKPTGEPSVARVCSECYRDANTLRDMKAYLLKAESPDCYICSLCLLGF